MSRSTNINWKTHDAESAIWSLLAPYIIQPKKGKRLPPVALQLRKGIAEEIVKNGGLLPISAIVDAMWDSELVKERSNKILGKESTIQ
jgi:hypothetical protein